MKAKLFWQKTNRGLWLGAILLIALVLLIIVTEVNFGLQKKKIRDVAKEYAQAVLSVNLVPGGELGEGGYLTEAQKKAQKAALDEIAAEYWYTGKIELNSHNYDLAKLDALLTQWQREVPGKILSMTMKPEEWEVDLQRDGPGRVLVSLTTDAMEVHGLGPAPKEESDEGILFPTEASGRVLGETQEWTRTCKVSFSLELVKRGGKWLVAGMNANSGYGYYLGYGLLGMI